MDNLPQIENALLKGSCEGLQPEEQLVLILKGMILSIQQDPSPWGIDLLGKAAVLCPFPDIGQLCITILGELAQSGAQAAQDQLYHLAIEDSLQTAIDIIRHVEFETNPTFLWQKPIYLLLYHPEALANISNELLLLTEGYQTCSSQTRKRIIQKAHSPLLMHWVQIVNLTIEVDSAAEQAFLKSYPDFTKEEKTLTLTLLDLAVRKPSQLAIETLCKLFVIYEDRQALELAKTIRVTPADPIQKAAFYFLAEEWDLYQKLDFNHTLISLAYENATEPVRKRLLNLSRDSGINDWLTHLSHRTRTLWLAEMDDTNWFEVINTSIYNHLWDELWKLSLAAPPVWGQLILNGLSKSGWSPKDDVDFYQSVTNLARKCSEQPFDFRKDHIINSAGKSITCLASNSQAPYLAAGTKDNDILIWDISQGYKSFPSLQGPAAMTRTLLFDPQGEHLVTANIDNAIRIYKISENKLIKTLPGHSNLVKTLVIHPEGRLLFSADFDGKMMVWRFPYGTELSQHRGCKGEIYKLALSANGNLLFSAGACQHIHIWDWNSWNEIKRLSTQKEIVSHLEISNTLSLAIFATTNRKIVLWNYDTEKIITEIEIQPEKGLITSISINTAQKIFVIATSTGEIQFRHLFSGGLITQTSINSPKTAVTSLVFHDQCQLLMGGTPDEKIVIWDLFPFLLTLKPIQSISLSQIERLQQLHKSSQSFAEKTWLEFMIAVGLWQKRFDIQISEEKPISMGEFDIFI